MRYINYCPAPVERVPDLSECGVLGDYELSCEEYPGVYEMAQFLANLRYCDYCPPQDDFYFSDGIIRSHWIIFFTCRPTDAERLAYVARQLKYPISIRKYDHMIGYGYTEVLI